MDFDSLSAPFVAEITAPRNLFSDNLLKSKVFPVRCIENMVAVQITIKRVTAGKCHHVVCMHI